MEVKKNWTCEKPSQDQKIEVNFLKQVDLDL